MDNENQTDETEATEVVEDKAPKKAAVTGKLVKEFTQLGEGRDIRITPIDTDDARMLPKTLHIGFGEEHVHRLQDDGEKTDLKVFGRFRVSMPRVIDGLEDNLIVFASNASKAVGLVIKNAGRGTVDDYEIDADYEEDFFKQKVEVEKVDPNDVYTNPIFASLKDIMASASGEVEGLLDSAQGSQTMTQEDYIAVAKVLVGLKDAFIKVGCKNFRAALASWAAGASGGSNHPLLKQFGNGANALTEAMRLAEVTDNELQLVPASVTSGKALDGFKSNGIAALVSEAGVKAGARIALPNQVTLGDAPDASGAAQMVRLIAEFGFGIDNAGDTENVSLEALIDMVNDAAADKAAAYLVDYGKHVNTYNKKEYDYAKLTYGRMWVSAGGHNLFADAVGQIMVILAAEGGDDIEKMLAEVGALFNKNTMMRSMLKATQSHATTLTTEKRNRELFKQVEDGEELLNKKTLNTYNSLSPQDKAGQLHRMMATDKLDGAEVWGILKSLVAQSGFDVEDQKEAA